MSLIKLQFEYFLKEDQLAQKLKQWLEVYYFLSIIDFVYLPW
jgi:hypothetical protein